MTRAEACAIFAARVRIERRHKRESFLELHVDGRFRSYCANLPTAIAIGAADVGVDPQLLVDFQREAR